jgi:superfamily I DNA/RNA helicase
VRNILNFPNQFTPPAEVVTLEQNYRSTEPILDVISEIPTDADFVKKVEARGIGPGDHDTGTESSEES